MTSFKILTVSCLALAWVKLASPSPINASNIHIIEPLIGPGFLKLPLTKMDGTISTRKRQTGVTVANPNNGYIYLVTIGFGTPAQQITMQLDTGTSEIWLNPACTSARLPAFCASLPQYFPTNSTTSHEGIEATPNGYNYPGLGNTIIATQGNYYTDNLTLGGGTIISQQQFGVCDECSGPDASLMGVGFGNGPHSFQTTYYNIIDQLAVQKITNSRAFSINLGGVTAQSSAIIFGGIDTMKFTGNLVANSIIPWSQTSSNKQLYYISLTSVGMTNQTSSGLQSTTWTAPGLQQNVVLDTGLWLSFLPNTIVNSMLTGFVNPVNQYSGRWTLPCQYLGDNTTTVDFGFAGITIHVPIYEFLYYDGALCWFGAVGIPAGQQAFLGDTFLRAAYAVYDQDNMKIWLAQAASCGTDIIAIGSGSGAVPAVVGACGLPVTSISTPVTLGSTTFTSSSISSTPLPCSPTATIYTTVVYTTTLPELIVTSYTTLPGQLVTTTLPPVTTTFYLTLPAQTITTTLPELITTSYKTLSGQITTITLPAQTTALSPVTVISYTTLPGKTGTVTDIIDSTIAGQLSTITLSALTSTLYTTLPGQITTLTALTTLPGQISTITLLPLTTTVYTTLPGSISLVTSITTITLPGSLSTLTLSPVLTTMFAGTQTLTDTVGIATSFRTVTKTTETVSTKMVTVTKTTESVSTKTVTKTSTAPCHT